MIEHSGTFFEDFKHGFGRSYYKAVNLKILKFEGEFKQGLPSGTGKIYYRNKAVYYSGEFFGGTPVGNTGLYWDNGNFNMVHG
jgi:antitoxin component YwqK of YwqJK toxin-antitoxin module